MSGAYAFDQLDPPPPPPVASAAHGGGDDHALALEIARAEGYGEGRREAEAELAGRTAALEEVLRSVATALERERGEVADRVERAAVELALRIAEQALSAAVAADPERVLDAVRGALRRLLERERVQILVNPDDLDLVREHLDRLVDELGGVEHCEVQAERRVARGGAVVRTAEGDVDATLETKLERAREVLDDELAGRRDA